MYSQSQFEMLELKPLIITVGAAHALAAVAITDLGAFPALGCSGLSTRPPSRSMGLT